MPKKRGKVKREKGKGGKPRGKPRQLDPRRYRDRLLRQTAKRINFILAHAEGRSRVRLFEAMKLYLDLRTLLSDTPDSPPSVRA